jgi:hypothetical protein
MQFVGDTGDEIVISCKFLEVPRALSVVHGWVAAFVSRPFEFHFSSSFFRPHRIFLFGKRDSVYIGGNSSCQAISVALPSRSNRSVSRLINLNHPPIDTVTSRNGGGSSWGTHLATGIIFKANARLRQKPAPPVANQNLTFCCKNRKTISEKKSRVKKW